MKQVYTLIFLSSFFPLFLFSQTVLKPGDLAVVTMNSDAPDVWAFVTFVDLTVGTKILFTDNGYERGALNNVATGLFSNSEEVLELEVTGSTIPAGTVITYDGSGPPPYTTPSNFIHTMVATNTFAVPPFKFDQFTASGDGIFIMQGTWNNGTVPGSSHDAFLTGTFIWGFNAKPWELLSGSCNTTSCSRLPPQLACYNNGFAHIDNYSYKNSAPKSGSLGQMVDALTNPANWDTDNTITFPSPTGPFTITSGLNQSVWTGNVDTDWFNCANWDNYRVPDLDIDALFPASTANNSIVLQPGDSAHCRDLTLTGNGMFFQAQGSNDRVLNVHRDLAISADPGSQIFNFDDGFAGTPDGEIYLYGNWTNNTDNADFLEGESTVHLVGTGNQSISVTTFQDEGYYDLVVDKSSGGVNLLQDITVFGSLDLTSGLINTSTNLVYVSNSATGSIFNHSTSSYVNGNLRRDIQSGAGPFGYDFPVGTASNYELAHIDFFNPGPIGFLDASFTSTLTGAAPSVTEAGFLYNNLLNGGIWTMTPGGIFLGSYNLTLYERGYTNGLANRYINVKRPNSGSAWANPGTHNFFTEAGGVVTCARNGLTAFSDFAIALASNPLPVKLESFAGELLPTGNAELHWEISSEYASRGYRLERRQTGEDFTPITFIESRNQPDRASYSFEDVETPLGLSFYRLIQVDQDGQESDLGTVEILKDLTGTLSAVAWPNPSSGSELQLNIQATGKVLGRVMTAEGRLLGELQGEAAALNLALPQMLAGVAPGIYFIRLINQETSLTLKVVRF
ncbi:MAG: T9SS type A sorting domain-containing protein [Bacteroidia bacterium]|nr:T9SS type A sorting domain-containing protein [Bacteroidia bacterium]